MQSRLVLRGCYVSPAMDVGAVGSEDCSVRIVHLASGRCLRRLTGHTGAVSCVAWSRQRHCIVSASDDHTLRLWRLRYTQQRHSRTADSTTSGGQQRQPLGQADDDSDEGDEAEQAEADGTGNAPQPPLLERPHRRRSG